jgi:hypothetical protein
LPKGISVRLRNLSSRKDQESQEEIVFSKEGEEEVRQRESRKRNEWGQKKKRTQKKSMRKMKRKWDR